MNILYTKKANKFLDKIQTKIRTKLQNKIAYCIENNISITPFLGLQDKVSKNTKRIKLEHYRILYQEKENDIIITDIFTKTNAKLRRNGSAQLI